MKEKKLSGADKKLLSRHVELRFPEVLNNKNYTNK